LGFASKRIRERPLMTTDEELIEKLLDQYSYINNVHTLCTRLAQRNKELEEQENRAGLAVKESQEFAEILGLTKEYGCNTTDLAMVMKIKEINEANTTIQQLEKLKNEIATSNTNLCEEMYDLEEKMIDKEDTIQQLRAVLENMKKEVEFIREAVPLITSDDAKKLNACIHAIEVLYINALSPTRSQNVEGE